MSDIIIGIKIAGFGLPESPEPDNRLRFVTMIPVGQESNPIYVKGLIGYPASAETEIDVKESMATLGAMDFALAADDDNVRRFMSSPASVGNLTASVSAVDTTFSVKDSLGNDVTGLVGDNYMLERECWTPTEETAPGQYTVLRGQAGTRATAHTVGLTSDTAVYPANRGPTLKNRDVEFFRMPADGTISDEIQVWEGAIRDVISPDPSIIQVACDDILTVLNGRYLWPNRCRAEYTQDDTNRVFFVRADEGVTRPLADDDFEEQLGSPTYRALFSIAGMTVIDTRYGLSRGGVGFSFGAQWGSTPPQRQTIVYGPSWTEVRDGSPQVREVWEVWTTSDIQPAIDGKQLSPNPLILILQLLTTTTLGNNGAYDLGNPDKPWIGENLGLGIPQSSIDIEAIEDRAETLTESQYYRNLWLGLEDKPPKALDFFQQLLRPLACVLTADGQGLLTVAKLSDTPDLDAFTIERRYTHGDLLQQGRRLSEPFEQIRAEYNERPGVGTISETLNDVVNLNRQQDGGAAGVSEIMLRGVATRDAVQNLVSQLIAVFSDPPNIVRFETNRTEDFKIGSVQRLTHPSVFNPDGGRGVVEASLFIEGKGLPLAQGRITYKGRIVPGRRGRIAPSARATGSSGNAITIETAAFTKVGGPFDEDSQGFEVGDVVQLLDETFAAKAGPFTIVSVSSTSIDVGTPPGAVAGDIVETVDYNNPPSANQLAKWTWIGDSSTLKINGDEPYEWSV